MPEIIFFSRRVMPLKQGIFIVAKITKISRIRVLRAHQGDRFHQDIGTMNFRYKGRCNSAMMG